MRTLYPAKPAWVGMPNRVRIQESLISLDVTVDCSIPMTQAFTSINGVTISVSTNGSTLTYTIL